MSHAITADYSLKPSELAATLAVLVEARQPAMLWGPPGCAKSMVAQQVAAGAARTYVDVRALLLDRVDLMGIPWRDSAGRTRWAPPSFLPPSDDRGLWLINLEELPSAVPMVQAALYQLALDRKCGEYELPEGASLIACGNREKRPRRGASDADAPGLAVRAPGDPRRCRRLVRLGRRERHCARSAVLHPDAAGTFSTSSIRSQRRRRFRAPEPGSSSPTSSANARA